MDDESPETQQMMNPVDANGAEEEEGGEEKQYAGGLVTCPPPTSTKFGQPLCCCKWFIPAFCFMISAFISMWFLHVAAFYYIFEMERHELIYTVNDKALAAWNAEYANPDGSSFLSSGIFPTDISYGSLEDPVHAALGFTKIDMKLLDKISAALPAAWFVLTLFTDDLQAWTKCITCTCLLAVGKGIFGLITIVPDSSGWQNCKERETQEGIARMKSEIGSPKDGFWSILWGTLKFETGIMVGKLKGEKGVRFCADMMYSGHTYFTTMYALGLVELTRMHTRHFPFATRMAIIGFVLLICVGEQVLEVVLVLRNRFHYTMDVAMAIILTFLVFTNGTIAVFAKWWCHWRPDADEIEENDHAERMQEVPQEVVQWVEKNAENWALISKHEVRSDGDVFTPICCVPFCTFWGRNHLVSDKLLHRIYPSEDDEGV